MEIKYVKGDATAPQTKGNKIIVHICNDIGGWGKGFVLAVSKKWKAPEQQYRQWYKERETNDFALGSTQLVVAEKDLWIANMIAQKGLKTKNDLPPIRYDAVEQCLEKLVFMAKDLDASVHMPRIGCGLAGGEWSQIESIVQKTLIAAKIATIVYDFE